MQRSATTHVDLNELFVMHEGVGYRSHPNGGGLVSLHAYVSLATFVGPEARVEDCAQITGQYFVVDSSIVCGNALLQGRGRLSNESRVSGNAVLDGYVTLAQHAHISGDAHLSGHITLEHHAHLSGETRLAGSLCISG